MPEKLVIIPNFVDESFEQEILKMIPPRLVDHKERNTILRYGAIIEAYKAFHKSLIIPEIFNQFHKDIDFDHISINEYLSGQFLDYHIDTPAAGPEICIISLLSDAVMKFKKGSETFDQEMPRYSLVRFSGDLRDNWEHFLQANERRISLVFRDSSKFIHVPSKSKIKKGTTSR